MADTPRPEGPVPNAEHGLAGAPPEAEAPAAPSPDPGLPTTLPILPFHPDGEEQVLFNRELSWLGFNERVLALAENAELPLLERAKFAAIFVSNLDEFFQVRVAGLKEQVAAGLAKTPPDGMTATEQLAAIRVYVTELNQRIDKVFGGDIAPNLDANGIRLCDWDVLDGGDRAYLEDVFEKRVFPVLTPLAVDPAHPFPYISNLSLNLAVVVRHPERSEPRFARVKVPPILPRFVVMADGERFVPLEQVIAAHLDQLFPGMEVVAHHAFRVTRNASLVVEEEEADDLLEAIESELTRRRFGRVVRLEVEPEMSPEVLELLMRELGISSDDVYELYGPLDLSGLWAIYDLDRPDLKYPYYSPKTQPRLGRALSEDSDLFATLRDADVLVQHPYDSFTSSVQTFIEEAARDPRVLAIKQTLYRTSGPGSPVVQALMEAAEEGKQVVALVELKARFDEEANIEWARTLEESGVHVVYGVVGFKTHTKTALVVRDEGGSIRRYAHVGTGNYNDKTARIYEDLGLLTADPDIGADLSELFNFLTGYSSQTRYRKLLVSPTTLRPRIIDLIEREAAEPDGRIVLKMNSLTDQRVCGALSEASRAGTPIDLIVRGICRLRPGVEGRSETITVRSIIGRYLEHSRIYRFGSDQRGYQYLTGSADLMTRNLNRRVEAVVPIEDPALQARLEEILQVLLRDDVLAWTLRSDGSWQRTRTVRGVEAHLALEELARERAAGS